jgi:hypothetical protein
MTEQMNKEDIRSMLRNHVEIDPSKINELSLGTSIRYFINEDGKYKFRTGGILIDKSNWDKGYVSLAGKGKTWFLQLTKSRIFYELTVTELEEKYKKIIAFQQEKIIKSRTKILEKYKNHKENYLEHEPTIIKKIKIKDEVTCYHKYENINISGTIQRIEKYNDEIYNFVLANIYGTVNIDPLFFNIVLKKNINNKIKKNKKDKKNKIRVIKVNKK